jgi:Co/Zn/Cd efflux system component
MVAVVAIAAMRVIGLIRRQHPARLGRDDLPWLLPTVVFFAWQVVVKAATGSFALLADSGRNAGKPLIAPLKALEHNLAHFNAHHFDQVDLRFLQVAILAAFALPAIVVVTQRRLVGS